jgi:hypothetical protein
MYPFRIDTTLLASLEFQNETLNWFEIPFV